ncbi:alpha/beta hydrolase (plasmid) [Rhodococcus opacus]|uniref:alpha/beta hydrolase n=1 Tax=Rhodococcus opacus TaxID=37919 RepID=UPI0034D32FC2
MSHLHPRHRTTVADFSHDRRRARLRQTRTGHRWVRFGRTRRTLVWLAMWILVPALCAGSVYWVHDVLPEQARLATTQPQIHPIYDAQHPTQQSTAVVELVGLGNLDATRTASSLPALSHIGQVWAVRYDNTGIDTKVISNLITTQAREQGVDAVVLSGHSMGGVIALEVADHLYRDTDLTVDAVILDCTPLDLHAVRARSRDAGENLLRWIGWIPGARESRVLRLLVETAARQDRFVDHSTWYPRIDPAELREVLREVLRDKILSGRAASNGLIESQFTVIVASGAIDNLNALAHTREGKPRPAIVFLRPRAAAADQVVDVDYSQHILIDHSGGPDGTLLVVKLDGTGHANPNQHPGTYNDAIAHRILPFLRSTLDTPTPPPTAVGEP